MPEPFPYQHEGAGWLASKKTALLADAPRLGKAVQGIMALDLIRANRALVVCRGVARANWRDEFAVWSARPWVCDVVYGGDSPLTWDARGPHVVVVSYESLPSVLARMPDALRFDCAIIDESHYVKSLEAKRSRLIFGKDGIPKKASRLWCLTGTPTPNGLASELWTTLFTFGLTKLPFWDFAKHFCRVEQTGFGDRIVGTNLERVPELQQLMAPKVLRRTASEVSVQLPKMSFSTVMVPPGRVNLRETTFWKWAVPTDRTAEFEQLLQEELGVVNGIFRQIGPDSNDVFLAGDVLEQLKAASKSISTLRRYIALQKLEPACELIASELESNAYRKCVIFAHHRDCILGASRLLHRFSPVTMYGGTNPKTLERYLKNFQNPDHRTRVFIGQISAAGTSISLSAAHHIFFLEESFTPEDNTQAAMRCGGVNQPNPIFVRNFCLENSYDYRLQNILRNKMKEAAQIFSKPASTAQVETNIPPELADLI